MREDVTRSIRALGVACASLALAGGVSAQVANDDCATATPISLNTSVTASTAQSVAGPDITSCTSSDTRDVWYRLDLTEDTGVEVTTCGGSTNYDTALSVWDVCGGAEIGCNDDTCGTASTVTFVGSAGTTYYIRVSGWSGRTGTYTLEVNGVEPPLPPSPGPDVIVGDLPSTQRWGALDGKVAFSAGTTSCNIGDTELKWISNTREHPVIGQNMYRLYEGRFEQVGQSWLKHGFLALAQSLCRPCNDPGNGARLGIGCSDPYSASLNGSQGGLGPRSEVNPSNGFFVYPSSVINQTGDTLFKRLVVEQGDILVQATGARFFIEGHYITPDDAEAGNGLNNASYREIRFLSVGGGPTNVGDTVRELPAITAWAEADPDVVLSTADYTDSGQTARFYVGSKATDNADGTWTYEYAVYNLNSDRAAGGFGVPAQGVGVQSLDFHDVDSHSGEPYDNTDWTGEKQGDEVLWWSPETYEANPDSNAIRWGTLYNFSFTTDAAPVPGQVRIDLFKPDAGGPDSLMADAVIPTQGGAACAADWNDDGNLNDQDFFDWVNDFFSQSGPQGQFDFNEDGFQNDQDWFDFVNAFFSPGEGCN